MTRLIERNTTTPKDEASKQIDTKDGLENYCDQLVDDCGWQRAPRIGLLPEANSITNPECKSALQLSKDSIFLDFTMCGAVQAASLTGKVFRSVGFLVVRDVTALVTGFRESWWCSKKRASCM